MVPRAWKWLRANQLAAGLIGLVITALGVVVANRDSVRFNEQRLTRLEREQDKVSAILADLDGRLGRQIGERAVTRAQLTHIRTQIETIRPAVLDQIGERAELRTKIRALDKELEVAIDLLRELRRYHMAPDLSWSAPEE